MSWDLLVTDAYRAATILGGEIYGYLLAGTLNAGSQQYAAGQKIKSYTVPRAAAPTVGTFTPSMAIPSGADEADFGEAREFSLTKFIKQDFSIKGEVQKQVASGPYGFVTPQGQVMLELMRSMMRHLNNYSAEVLSKEASRAVGVTSGSAFATSADVLADARTELVRNGFSPSNGSSSAILSLGAYNAASKLPGLINASASGSNSTLRQGVVGQLYNLDIRESHGTYAHTKGTGVNYVLDGAHAVGATSINVKTGTGTVLAGDVITIGGHKYVNNIALSGGKLTIAAPGLLSAQADGATVTINDSHEANIVTDRAAFEIAMRPPAQVSMGDMEMTNITRRQIITHPGTGISFELAGWGGDGMANFSLRTLYEVIVWDQQRVIKLMSGV
jgi:hypothetical protein